MLPSLGPKKTPLIPTNLEGNFTCKSRRKFYLHISKEILPANLKGNFTCKSRRKVSRGPSMGTQPEGGSFLEKPVGFSKGKKWSSPQGLSREGSQPQPGKKKIGWSLEFWRPRGLLLFAVAKMPEERGKKIEKVKSRVLTSTFGLIHILENSLSTLFFLGGHGIPLPVLNSGVPANSLEKNGTVGGRL